MPPTFSVVIPTYNQADFLRDALKSVLSQTYQDFEVVLVNNYSSDHTLDVIDELNDGRMRVINFRNYGVISASHNVAIKASTAPYIAFLDSDDAWYPTKLERVAEAISENPEAGGFCHDQDLIREGQTVGQATFGPSPEYKGELREYLLLKGNCITPSAAVIARKHLDKVGYWTEDPDLVTVEDFDLWMKLSQVCNFHFIHELLGLHYFHQSSASANVDVHLKATLAVMNKYFDQHKDSGQAYSARTMRRQHSNAYYGAARQYHRAGVYKKTLTYYCQALMKYPFRFRAYAGLILLAIDRFIGQDQRRWITKTLRLGSGVVWW